MHVRSKTLRFLLSSRRIRHLLVDDSLPVRVMPVQLPRHAQFEFAIHILLILKPQPHIEIEIRPPYRMFDKGAAFENEGFDFKVQ